MLGTGKTSTKNEGVHALQQNYAQYRFSGTRDRDDSDTYTDDAMRNLTHPRNYMIVKLVSFMIRCIIALYLGLSCSGIRAIINDIVHDLRNERKIEVVDKKDITQEKE